MRIPNTADVDVIGYTPEGSGIAVCPEPDVTGRWLMGLMTYTERTNTVEFAPITMHPERLLAHMAANALLQFTHRKAPWAEEKVQ